MNENMNWIGEINYATPIMPENHYQFTHGNESFNNQGLMLNR